MGFPHAGHGDDHERSAHAEPGGDDGGDAKGEGQQKLAKKGEKLKEEMDALVDEIDEVLARMEADGRLRHIMDKYIKK